MKDLSYVTTAGLRIKYEPVSTVLLEYMEQGVKQRFREAGKPVDIPTYAVQTAGGGEQQFEFDDKYVEENPAQAALWQEYKETQRAINAEIAGKRNKELMLAVKVEMPMDGSWLRRQRRMGVLLPVKPAEKDYASPEEYQDALLDYEDELYVHYLQTEILKTVEDVVGIIDAIMRTSLEGAVSKEMLDAMSASFRDSLPEIQRQTNPAGSADSQER